MKHTKTLQWTRLICQPDLTSENKIFFRVATGFIGDSAPPTVFFEPATLQYLRTKKLIVMVLPGLSRRCWNDTLLSLRDAGLCFWCMICLVMMNVDSVLWSTEKVVEPSSRGCHAVLYNDQKVNDPLLNSEIHHVEQDLDLQNETTKNKTSTCKMKRQAWWRGEILKWTCGIIAEALVRKFPKIGMCRWWACIMSVHQLAFLWTRRLVFLSFIFVMIGGKTIEQAHLLKALAGKARLPSAYADVDKAGTKEDKEERRLAILQRVVLNMVAVAHLCRHAEDFLSVHGVGKRLALESALLVEHASG